MSKLMDQWMARADEPFPDELFEEILASLQVWPWKGRPADVDSQMVVHATAERPHVPGSRMSLWLAPQCELLRRAEDAAGLDPAQLSRDSAFPVFYIDPSIAPRAGLFCLEGQSHEYAVELSDIGRLFGRHQFLASNQPLGRFNGDQLERLRNKMTEVLMQRYGTDAAQEGQSCSEAARQRG